MIAEKKARIVFIIFILFGALLLNTASNAQTNYHFSIYTQEDGLASGTLRSIKKDSAGYLWLLSENGLSRFDGYTFKTFRHNTADPKSISSSDVTAMEVGRGGKILFRTDNGISSYNPLNGTFKKLYSYKNNNSINDFYSNQYGFWIINPNSIIHIDNQTEKLTTYLIPKNTTTFTAVKETELPGSIWLNRNQRIINFNPVTKKFAFIPFESKNENNNSSLQSPLKYFTDTFGASYFYSFNGLFKFNEKLQKFIQISTTNITNDPANAINGFAQINNTVLITLRYNKFYFINLISGVEKQITLIPKNSDQKSQNAISGIYPSQNGIIWISTSDVGIFQFNTETEELVQFTQDEKNQNGLPSNNFEYIFQDHNVLWLTSPGVGLIKAEPITPIFASYQPIKNTNARPFELYKNIRSIAELDKNHLLIGSLDGLSLFSKQSHSFQSFTSFQKELSLFQNLAISKIIIDSNQNVWVSDWSKNGVYIFNNANQKSINIRLLSDANKNEYSTVRSMFLDSYGYLWLGTNADLIYRINTKNIDFNHPENVQFEKIKGSVTQSDTLIFNITFAIAENIKREILIGTQNGFYIYSYKTKRFERFINQPHNPQSISDNNIRSFYIDKNNIIWIGTFGAGLNRFDEQTKTFKSYKIENGLPDNSIYSILEDNNNNLWMGTNRGICRFNIQSESCRNYSLKDGIQNYEFNTNAAYKLSTGELVFGGINGFNIFNPDSLANNSEIPKVVITQFKVGENEKSIGNETYHLHHNENYLSFQFAALNFFRNNENKYAYKLDGLDKDWVYCGDRRFTNYANLSPGTYTFRVKAANYFGEWNNDTIAINFVISNAWYNTLLFKLVVLLFLSAIVYAIFRYRLKQKLKLQDVRNRIASDLHDEIGSTLSSIALYSEVAQKIIKVKAPEANSMMIQISESTGAMMEALSDIVWTINTRNDRFDNIVNRMNAYAVERMEPLNCKVKMETGENISSVKLNMEQRKNVYLVFKEAVNNAAKYSGCSDLAILLSTNHRMFILKVSDNGKGFNASSILNDKDAGGNGLQNMRKRANELNGTFTLTSDSQTGTAIEMTFELKNH